MKKRNLNIEMMRGIAIIMMLFYHYNQIIPNFIANINMSIFNEGLGAGALTFFYAISGYGTYIFLDSNDISYKNFLKRRAYMIMPHYFFVYGIVVFTSKAWILGKDYWFNILSEVLFIQNFSPERAGINGVTWTLALIMQFYLVAFWLYKLIKKYPNMVTATIILFSLLFTRISCQIITDKGMSDIWLVAASMRWLPSTLSIFVCGMYAAAFPNLVEGYDKTKKVIIVIMYLLMLFGFVKLVFAVGGGYGNGFKYILREPIMGIWVSIMLWLVSQLKLSFNSFVGKGIQTVAKYEYGIYLWHMIIMGNISANSSAFTFLAEKCNVLLLIMMIVLAIGGGIISTKLVESEAYRKIYKIMLRME